MVRCQITSSAHTFLLFALLGLLSNLTDSSPINLDRQAISDRNDPFSSSLSQSSLPATLGDEDKRAPNKAEEEEEEEDELFKDVDPKTLAAVLLEALNKPQEERNSEGAVYETGAAGKSVEEEGLEVRRGGGTEEEEEEEESNKEEPRDLQADRGRDGQEELERAVAAVMAKGREEREREEEEERKKKAEEEERLTEKVTSHTTSQTVPMKVKTEADEGQKEQAEVKYDESPAEEEEEQLSPEEVKNLQSMMEKFQRYSTVAAESQDAAEKTGPRESRGDFASDYTDNDIRPKGFRGYNLGLSKKKLKWKQQQQQQQRQQQQQEQQQQMQQQQMQQQDQQQQEVEVEQPKPKTRPPYRGGNFMDDFNDSDRSEEEEEQEDEEEVISPEEEEARAKAEQEEVRRQAAEAQRAKAEEEKLADMASDMLLQYMMKQDERKSQAQQRKKNLFGMNAAEDKRSEEEEETDMVDDDIDPQTIDKLIEISSKLHLPADDVVDIISDVEKKKKDAPEILTWQRPLMPLPAPAAETPAPRFPTPVKQLPAPVSSPFKSWFKDRAAVKPSKQDFWLKPQRQPFRAYSPYPFYQKTYPSYYPIYFPPPKPKPRYYAKPSYAFNPLMGNSLDYDFDFSPKRRYRGWSQPRLRTPPILPRNPYFPNYIMPHPRSFAAAAAAMPVPMPKARSAAPPRHQPAFYYPPPGPLVTRAQDYYSPRRPVAEQESDEELENFIEKVFLKHPRMFQ